jgi:hypothetical protein
MVIGYLYRAGEPSSRVVSRKSPCCPTCAASPTACARAALGKLGVAALKRLDDPVMVGNRAGRTVVLVDRDLADRASGGNASVATMP